MSRRLIGESLFELIISVGRAPTHFSFILSFSRLFNDVIHTVGADEGPAVGLLTSENRDNWTKVRLVLRSSLLRASPELTFPLSLAGSLYQARDHLISISKTNAETLEAIQSAIVVVALDDSDPTSSSRLDTKLNDRSWRLWVGEGGVNRWFDKHQCEFLDPSLSTTRSFSSWAFELTDFFPRFSVIVLPSGRSGFNGEHSLLDGTPTLRLNEFIIASLEKGKVDLVGEAGKKGAAPVELQWVLDDKAKASVEAAAKAHWEVMGRHNLEVSSWFLPFLASRRSWEKVRKRRELISSSFRQALQYGGYGKDLIKHYKCSPDAWAQLVMHLAFFNMEG